MNQVRFKNGAAVIGYNGETYFPRKTLSFMDRFAQFSVIAAREAVTNAGIEWNDELRETLRSSPAPAWAAGSPTKSVIGNSSTMAGIASTRSPSLWE